MTIQEILEKLKKVISSDEAGGVFLSLFDEHKQCIGSKGFLDTDKSIANNIVILYNTILQDNKNNNIAKYAIVDIVQDIQLHTQKDSLYSLNVGRHGICLVSEKNSGVLLPGTTGIEKIADAIRYITKKYSIAGKVRVYSFTTKRIYI